MFRRSAIRAGLLTGTAALMLASQAARGREPVDIELVLAVDVSGSVDGAEQELQRAGLVAAFRDPEVISAIAALPRGLAVALVAWAGVQETAVAWHRLTDRASVDDFAARMEAAMPATFGGSGNTAIGDALIRSLAELAGNGFAGQTKIDVSRPGPVRDDAVRAGVTINGLAIVNEQPSVAEFCRANVIGRPGAFVLAADDYHDFGEALRRKLLRELAPGPTAAR